VYLTDAHGILIWVAQPKSGNDVECRLFIKRVFALIREAKPWNLFQLFSIVQMRVRVMID
jgi:hypothetical protein